MLGLHLVNNTNLDYFRTEHHADIFKLKAMLYQAMDSFEESFQLYFTSVHIKSDEANTWLCWGSLCSSKYEALADQAAKLEKRNDKKQVRRRPL